MGWNSFIWFAIPAFICWCLGAFFAWKGKKAQVYGFTLLGIAVFFYFTWTYEEEAKTPKKLKKNKAKK